jgi:MFS family permease
MAKSIPQSTGSFQKLSTFSQRILSISSLVRGPDIETKTHPLESPVVVSNYPSEMSRRSVQVTGTSFLALFSIVGLALWGLPFYYDFMVQQFGWTRAEVTSGNALSKLVVGPLFGFMAGWVVDRFGPRKLMIAGILMAGGALAGLGSVSTLGMFYFFYFFNALGYVCGGPLPNQVLLTRWFDKSRGKAMGIAYLGIGLGGAAVPWISHFLVQHFGWQTALRMLGLLVIAMALPLALVLKEPPGVRRPTPRAGNQPSINPFKTVPFYLLAIGSMCSIAAVSGTQQNLKLFLTFDLHYAQGQATRLLSLVLAASIAGRLLMGWLADRIAKKYVMLLIYLVVAAAIPFLFVSHSPGLLYVFAILFGIGLGGDYMVIPLMTAEIFNVQLLGRLMGVILTADGIAEAVAPWVVGRMRDVTGAYSGGFLVLIGLALLGAIAVTALPKRGARA